MADLTVYSLDTLRSKYPNIGFALYAYEPKEPVILEVFNQAGTFKFTGATEEEVVKEFLQLLDMKTEPEPDPAEPEFDIFG